MSFGERALSQLFKLKERGECAEFKKLKKNPHFEEIAKELTGGRVVEHTDHLLCLHQQRRPHRNR